LPNLLVGKNDILDRGLGCQRAVPIYTENFQPVQEQREHVLEKNNWSESALDSGLGCFRGAPVTRPVQEHRNIDERNIWSDEAMD